MPWPGALSLHRGSDRAAGPDDDPLRQIFEQLPCLIWATDPDLRFTSVAGQGLAALGLSAEALRGVSLYEHFQLENAESSEDSAAVPVRAHLQALAGESVSYAQEWGGRRVRARIGPLRDEAGQIVGVLGVAVEAALDEPSAETLYHENERAQVTLASIGDGVIRTDAQGRIDYLNPVAERLTGWAKGAALGRPVPEVWKVVDEMTREPLADPIERCLRERHVVQSVGQAILLNVDGKEYAVRDSTAPILDRAGNALGAVLVFKDVSDLRSMEREMIYLASHDPLTGLINRREFEIRLKRAIRNARAEQRQHALLYLDLDEFKVVNDTCGHLVGDEMLKQVTALLRARVRRSDVLARLGGDEFGVLLEDCPVVQARDIAEEMRSTLRDFRFSYRDQLFGVGVSVGLVPIEETSGDLGQILSAADAACYVAKERGRNRVHEYEPDDTAVVEHYGEMQWVQRIHSAFEERRFRLFYQLIQPLASDSGTDELLCEVLLRMLDRQGQVIEPTAFIAAAERFSIMTGVDRWVVKTALRTVAESQRQPAVRPLVFTINLSGQSLSDAGFLPFVTAELEASGVDPRRIAFEITETAAISKLDSARRFIEAIKSHGCRFILDDFGTGLSSFAYLRDLSVDYLKIDGEFVQHMMEDRIRRAMVESINQIGHVMGIKTIAEWVDNPATLEAVRALGVDYAQGNWLCRPQPLVHDR
ncbi:MAG: EAL domain-containing protein [Acidobacteriota bacterium]|nr:EAL domain-containing protein [Acidobacteriota bacterium]